VRAFSHLPDSTEEHDEGGHLPPGPAAGSTSMTGLPRSLLFEKRLPPGFRDQDSGQSRSLPEVF
jgi:hypothetical protein